MPEGSAPERSLLEMESTLDSDDEEEDEEDDVEETEQRRRRWWTVCSPL